MRIVRDGERVLPPADKAAKLRRAVNLAIDLLAMAAEEMTPLQRIQLAERVDQVGNIIRDSAGL
jgi:hypothetical protein